MAEMVPRQGSLVLYKTRPARVKRAGKKLDIELPEDAGLSVRLKDVVLLHPGPLESLDELEAGKGEVKTAWELLAGSTTDLAELAELAYGDYTPATAWGAWQWVADGVYFEGTPQEIRARSPQAVAEEQAAREARAAEERAWQAFLVRAGHGGIEAEDGPFLREVEDLALGRLDRSRVLRELGRAESAEGAHALLLELGYWDETVNPYPQRLGLPTASPDLPLPTLPQEDRLDLTHLPAFAIDDEGNQEPDDALSLEGRRLWVHIADVAALVPPDSPADLEARTRGATLFLPEGPVPMLPWPAIERLGLGLAETSPALSFGLDLDAQGGVTGLEVVPTWVRVTRLTYAQAEARLGEEPLQALYRVAQANEARRVAQGAFPLDLPEVKLRLRGDEIQIEPIPPLRSRNLVTEAMLMAGEAVARLAREAEIPLPFTTQDPPEVEARPARGDLSGMFAARRGFRPSEYSTLPGPHAGLGLASYAQATSPLRRYLDLVVHQQMRAYQRGEPLLGPQEVVERVGATAAVSGSVRQAEWLSNQHWKLVYLQRHPAWQGEGIVVEQGDRSDLVMIPELDLSTRLRLRGKPRLNSSVRLAFRGANLPLLDVYFRVAGR
jgi:exoribonuclease-2